MARRSRPVAVCAALLIFALLFSVLFTALAAGHECDGEHCAVCRQIQLCETLLEQSAAAPAAAAGAAGLFLLALLSALCPQRVFAASSPVLLRVKLLN